MARESDPRFPATARRRQRARAEGQVAISRDLTRGVLLLSAAFLMFSFGPALVSFVIDLTKRQLTAGGAKAEPQYWVEQWQSVALGFVQALAPIVVGMSVIALACHLVQTKFLFRPGAAAPDMRRINPARGWARCFSWNNVGYVGFGLLKAVAIVAAGGLALYATRDKLLAITNAAPHQIAATAGSVLINLLIYVSLSLVALALLDYLAQRGRYERMIGMTAEELREEVKSQAGGAEFTARRRRVRRSLAKGQVAAVRAPE